MPEVYGNRYEVIERVGDGGMATVYRGLDRVLKRDVAIKVMHPHLASRNDARARFNREAQAIARLHHGNIVDVYDFSVGTDEAAFLVTEFVHGETLSQFVNGHGPFLPQAAALIGHAVAAALAHAHTVGIVHRDIKPDNLMISRDGQIKLMDFGIATAMDLEQMTATGAIVGSPAHMAPEQIEGSALDHRCDIFAFGTVLYFLVTRKLPFVASNPHALFRLILEGKFDAASRHNPQVDRAFDAIIAQCLARQPADRWPNMTALQNALTTYLKQFRMSDVATLLPRFLKAPEVFQFDLKPTLVRVMTAEGRRQAEAGQLALAIDSFNRALVMAPDADEPKRGLHELMTRQRRRKHMRRWLTVSGAVTAAALATWMVVALVREPAEPVRARPTAMPLKLPMLPAAPRYVKQAVAAPPAVVPPPVVALPALVTPSAATVLEVRPAPQPTRRTWPRWEPREHVTPPQPDVIEPPPLPVHKQIVQFGADPTSAILKLRRQGEARADEIGQGAGVRRELEDGAWALICEYPTAACPACTPAQLVKVRPFVLPLRYQAPIKCEKPTAE